MKIYLVGGAVRDKLLGLPIKERDFVVVGAQPEDLLRLGYKQVGKEFPVFLHPKTAEEYALARKERKVSPGYTGFEFDSSPEVTLEEDLLRRDLTVNAMAESEQGEIIDPYQGKNDLEQKLLRHVSDAFEEDPVRILRIARFAARFADRGFKVAPETNALMEKMVGSGEVDALVAERVWKELERAFSEARPEVFFQVLADCQALAILFPSVRMDGIEILALKKSAEYSPDTVVRFAAFMHAYSREDILWLCKRYRLPADYQEVALVVAEHYEKALSNPPPLDILELAIKTDAFRREERFNKFILTCQVLAEVRGKVFSKEQMQRVYQVAKQADVKEFLDQGLSGEEIGKKLKVKREALVSAISK